MRNLYTVLKSLGYNGYSANPKENNHSGFESHLKFLPRQIVIVALLLFSISGKSWGQTWTIGTGTASNATSGITPFTTYYQDGRTQYVYLASELTAAGATAGLIHQFGFDWSAAGGQAATNVNLKMANTTATNITALQAPTWTNVWSSASVSPTVSGTAGSGYNLWTLSTPFNWNGTSNIIIEICFDNASYTSNWGVRVTQFATGVSRTYGFYADGVAGCSMTSGGPASAANRRNRPNARFVRLSGCTGTPNAGTASISSASGCAPSSTTLTASGVTSGAGITYQWQSGPSATGPWTNISGATASTYNVTTATGTTFYKLVTTCSNSSTSNSSNAVSYVGTSCASNSVPATGSNVVACGTNTYLYDNGGAAGNYVSNSNGYTVLDNSGSGVVTISGSFSYVESSYDYLRIYSGIGTGGTLLATYSNSAGGTIAPYSSAPGTPITVQFTSDGSGEGGGFAMQVLYSGTCAPPCVPTGDQTSYGAGSWIGYVYNAATAGAFTTYKGIVTEATTFNRTHTTIAAGATAPHCSMNADLFTIRYKNTTNFPAAYYTFSVGGDDGVRFSVDGGATWLINNWIDQGYTVSSNPIPVYLSGNVNMVFEYFENSGGAQSSFSYVSSPACAGTPTPGNTVASATQVISGGTSNLSLQNAITGGGVTYQWQSATSSTGPWTDIAGATNPTYTATITANTWYQCSVTCTASAATAASTPVQITLAYCSPSAASVDGSGITNVTFGVGPIVNNTTGAEANNYGNYSAQAGGLVQGASATVAITFNTLTYDYNTIVWVDWNNDLDFADAGEQVYTGLSSLTSPNTLNATFPVPATAVVGANYRMRIGAGDAAAPSYCTTGASYTCFEDYTITVVTPPACATPSALVGTITSTTDATLTWTAPASAPASGYNYFYSTISTAPTGSTIPSGSSAAGVTTASISGLTPNTTYYFWVQSNCGGTGTSAWAGSSSFVTSFVVPASGSNTYTTCSGTLYDNGGAAGNYAASSNGTTVLLPGTAGASVSLTFTAMDVESGWDYVYVYNGNSTAAAQVAGSPFSGTTIPATIISTAANGALTVVFTSDGSGEYTGFAANIACISPCAGTPTPGATTATSAQVFAAGSTTLGIATLQPTGTTYQWQSSASASGPWTNIGGATAATYVASPTTATYYQCIVTCAAASASATSTSILITVNPYCEPVYTTGKTDGDLISNISIGGTTLSNNSGTAQTNPAYTFFTGQPNYTCDLVAANSYTVNVTVGTWGSQGIAAWIDYNDNNVFEPSEMIGSTPTTIGTGTGGTPIPANHTASFTINLSCTPPLGTHRMRVRDVFFANGPSIDPCATYSYGETEDYLVTIIAGPAFTPVFTTTPAATSCIGTTVNYVATAGQTNYAWTFAGTAGTDYTVASGGTSTSNTASVTWITGGAHSMTMNYASPLGCASSGPVSNTVTMPTAGSSLAQDNEDATCTVNQNGWVHFYHSSGRLIGSINSQGQDLGNVTVTSYVDGTNSLVPACTNSNPIYSTSVMQRHWVITPTTQPTTPVLVRFPYSNAEFSGLTSAASTNANSNDDLLTPADLGMTKYSNGSNANVNSNPLDNCGVGTSTFHAQLGTGLATSYSGVTANYVDFQIPGFSEFWLHGSSQASPLPVELVSFQANCAGEGKVNVTWATASEHNSANFTVEKSRDGINWTVLASLAGAGNATQMINYSIADNNASAGENYYRLTQTDFDGASETFNIASANCGDNSSLTTVKVYPNPSAGDFYIDFTSEEITGSSVITITDARGMEVYKMNVTVEKGNNVYHIDNMEAAPGMYYIQVSNGTNTSNIVKHSLR